MLLFQALLWLGGPSVEAWSESRSLGATAHVEHEDSRTCPPIHSHFDCQICRTLRTGATTATAVTLPWREERAHGAAVNRAPGVAATAAAGPHSARAPPVA